MDRYKRHYQRNSIRHYSDYMKRDILITFAFILVILVILLTCAILGKAYAENVAGTIRIPSINADFDLVWTSKQKEEHQHNALLYKRQGCQHVGNHYGSSGTWKLENVKVGDKAYLVKQFTRS